MDIRKAIRVLFILAVIIPLTHSISSALQTVVLNVTVNRVNNGEFYVVLEDDGDFRVKAQDLSAMGFRDPKGTVSIVEGETYISLRSMEGVVFSYNEKTLSLDINADPLLLGKSTMDFQSRRPQNVYYPKDGSAFLNYRFNYLAGDSMRFQSFGLNNQLGVRSGDVLFLGDTAYAKTDAYSRFTRLMTSVTYDRREDLVRGVAGDFATSSRELGGTLNMGGVSYSKVYHMNPYFIKYPTLDITGLAAMPSDVEVYVDDMRLTTGKIAPGEFELKNISRYGGTHKVEIVLRDPYGGVQRIVHPFYQTEALLKKGLHEFSYNAGFLRRGFGTDSFDYGPAVLSFYHLYGVNGSLTAGFRGEAGDGTFNVGPEATVNTGTAGTLTMSAAAGRGKSGESGSAGSVNYSYYGRKASTRLLVRSFSRGYANVGDAEGKDNTALDLGAGASYTKDGMGSFSLDYSNSRKHSGIKSRVVSAGFSRGIWKGATFHTTVKRKTEAQAYYEVFAGLVYYFGKDSSTSLNYQKARDGSTVSAQAQSPAPAMGTGMGMRASVDRTSAKGSKDAYSLNPIFDYNTRHAVFRGDFRERVSAGENTEAYEFSAAGAVAHVGGVTGFTRPINDSFGLVKAGDLKDVKVYLNNEQVGETDEHGLAFVPFLGSYYDNQVSINDKGVSMEYTLSNVSMLVSPPLRSGSCISFTATKTQAFMGTLKTMVNGKAVPLEYYEVTAGMWGRDVLFPSGKDGEFYFDNAVQPDKSASTQGKKMECAPYSVGVPAPHKDGGRHTGYVWHEGKRCVFEFSAAETDAAFMELGEIICSPEDGGAEGAAAQPPAATETPSGAVKP